MSSARMKMMLGGLRRAAPNPESDQPDKAAAETAAADLMNCRRVFGLELCLLMESQGVFAEVVATGPIPLT